MNVARRLPSPTRDSCSSIVTTRKRRNATMINTRARRITSRAETRRTLKVSTFHRKASPAIDQPVMRKTKHVLTIKRTENVPRTMLPSATTARVVVILKSTIASLVERNHRRTRRDAKRKIVPTTPVPRQPTTARTRTIRMNPRSTRYSTSPMIRCRTFRCTTRSRRDRAKTCKSKKRKRRSRKSSPN
uniref:(northern house mosquito) hypothetical protein n=1 Tax=Culex pipiens TaxID=7175 RepID=A0A8D8BTB7_CULPI